MDIAARADLLRETGQRHGPFEKTHVPHNWADWYAAYLDAREEGSTPDEASEAARRYMEDVLHIAAL
jgi:alpha-galactosidase